jgi:hypothetical protein
MRCALIVHQYYGLEPSVNSAPAGYARAATTRFKANRRHGNQVSGTDRKNFATIVMPAGIAQAMRTLQLAAIRTFVEGFNLQRIVAATHPAAGRAGFSLGDGHFGTCS